MRSGRRRGNNRWAIVIESADGRDQIEIVRPRRGGEIAQRQIDRHLPQQRIALRRQLLQ
jgi:hypothetical protein